MRAFFTDFNNPKGLARLFWWEPPVRVDEDIVLVDHEFNFALGKVTKISVQPDSGARKDGLIHSTWDRFVDSETVLSLILAHTQQQTGNPVPTTVTLARAASNQDDAPASRQED